MGKGASEEVISREVSEKALAEPAAHDLSWPSVIPGVPAPHSPFPLFPLFPLSFLHNPVHLKQPTPREFLNPQIHMFTPHLQISNVLELDVPRLRKLGLDALLLDVDCTLKEYRAEDVTSEVAAWLHQLREAGVGLCLVSNGHGPRIGRLAKRLDLPFVSNALKPLPWGCRSAVRMMGFDRQRTAMVGDQVFADVMAGRLAGLFTILVDPIRPEQEPWFTRLKRPLENRLVTRGVVENDQ